VRGAEICFLSAEELERLIRGRELSAEEAMEACLDQVERTNPRVNAIVTLIPERALQDARAADERLAGALARGEEVGPLHGLPVAHKDLAPTRGIRTTFGSLIYKDFIPDEDALIVERLRRAGAITVGKTNTPEFGAGSQERYGRVPAQPRLLLQRRWLQAVSRQGALLAYAGGLVVALHRGSDGAYGARRRPDARYDLRP
jgi:Asp-tRNA(Asn)/Glu-tRNA(Gln) amidotransferase A subunit family amidase